jgi:hypothetical protein
MPKFLLDAFAFHQIVTDSKGNHEDYIFSDVNNAFEEMTGLLWNKVIGKRRRYKDDQKEEG